MAATDGGLVDRVIDVEFGANLPVTVEVLKVGGILATYSSNTDPEPRLPFVKMMYKDMLIRMIIVYAMPESAKQSAIDDIERALIDNTLQHRIAKTMPLAEIARSNELIEQGSIRGAVVLTSDEKIKNQLKTRG